MPNEQNKPQTSPTPIKKKVAVEHVEEENTTFNFYRALKEMELGQKVTKLEWADEAIYGYLEGVLKLNKRGTVHQWIVNDGDIMGEDWIIIK